MFPIDEVWVDPEAEDAALTRRTLARLPGARVVRGAEVAPALARLLREPDPFSRGKRILRLRRHFGASVKPCPGTPEYVCCGLEILHTGQGCPMDCRYCALQGYFNRPVLEVFVNMDEIIKALREYRAVHHERFHRICTGEFADSLALDPLTDTASRLVEEFAGYTDCSLELKTKTDFIEPLLDIDPKGRTVLGFSMNLPEVWRKEERFAVSPEKRLRAAQRAAQRGYRVAFHFDPIMPWGDRLPLYGRVVDSIYRKVPAEAVAWISLGVFRFVPGLADVAEQRFGTIPHYHQEFVPGLDGKHRAFVDARIEVCRFMSDRIRGHDPGARVYLCMESRHVWERALGVPMGSDAELTAYLDAAFPAVAPDGGRTERP